MQNETFTAREAPARAILHANGKHRSVLLTGRSGIGKTALLEFIAPVLEQSGLTIRLDRVAPFGNFLRELHTALWDAKAFDGQTSDLEVDRKAWAKANPNNDTKARALVAALEKWAGGEVPRHPGHRRRDRPDRLDHPLACRTRAGQHHDRGRPPERTAPR